MTETLEFDAHEPVPQPEEGLDYLKEHTGDDKVYENYKISYDINKVKTALEDGSFYKIKEHYDSIAKSSWDAHQHLQNDTEGMADEHWVDNVIKYAKIHGLATTISANLDKGRHYLGYVETKGKVQEINPHIYTEEFLNSQKKMEPVSDPFGYTLDETVIHNNEPEKVEEPPKTFADGREMYKKQIRQHDLYKTFFKVCEKSGLSMEASDKIAGTLFLVTGYSLLAGAGTIALGVLASLVSFPFFTARVIQKAKKQRDEEISKNPKKKASINKKYQKIINHK